MKRLYCSSFDLFLLVPRLTNLHNDYKQTSGVWLVTLLSMIKKLKCLEKIVLFLNVVLLEKIIELVYSKFRILVKLMMKA